MMISRSISHTNERDNWLDGDADYLHHRIIDSVISV